MTTSSSILKIGNSCGIIIPAKILRSLSLSEKDTVILSENGGCLTLKKQTAAEKTPFSALDIWCQEHGYSTDDTLAQSLEFVDSIRSERQNKEITEW